MNVSLAERGKAIPGGLTAPNRTIALAREAMYIDSFGGAKSINDVTKLLNKINSPGLKYLFWWF